MPFATVVLIVGLQVASATPPPPTPAEPQATAALTTAQQPDPQKPDQGGDKEKKPDSSEEKKPPTPPHTGVRALLDGLKEDVKHLPSKSNLYIAALGGGLALAAHPADENFNRRLISHYDVVNTAFKPGKIVGQTPLQVGAAILTYTYGRVFDQPKVSHFGMDLIRAQIINDVLTQTLKITTHRERPNHEDRRSFPSGHASITFATATVIERHLGWKQAALGYTIASYVAASRLHDNKHHLSDVIFGAAVGTIAGRTVTEHGREVWTFAPAPVPGGVAMLATKTFW